MSVFSARDADRSPMGLIGSQANVAHGGRADSVYTEPRREALGWDLALEQSLIFRNAFLSVCLSAEVVPRTVCHMVLRSAYSNPASNCCMSEC